MIIVAFATRRPLAHTMIYHSPYLGELLRVGYHDGAARVGDVIEICEWPQWYVHWQGVVRERYLPTPGQDCYVLHVEVVRELNQL